MFVLVLNDMRSPKIELSTAICRAETREEILALIDRETVPSYQDEGKWGKQFRKGGPLEWYNPPCAGFGQGIVDAGTEESWAKEAVEEFNRKVMSVIPIESLN